VSDLLSAIHDLRSPLARAKTLAKLLRDASPEDKEECVRQLLLALEQMDERLTALSQHPH